MSKKAVNVILLTISQGVNTVLFFLFAPYLARALEKNILGSYMQVTAIADVTSMLTSIAIIQIAMMFFSNLQKNFEDTLKTVILFTFCGGLIGAVLFFIFSYVAPTVFENTTLGPWFRIFAMSIIGSKLNMVLNQAMIKINKTRFVMVLSIATNFTKLCLALVAIQIYDSVMLLLIIYALEPIVSCIFQLVVLAKMKLLNGRFDSSVLKDIFYVGLPLYIVDILSNSYTYVAMFIIGIYLNEEQFAIYKNGSIELPVIGTLFVTISTIFMTDMSVNIQQNNFAAIVAMKKKMITTTAIVLFPVAVFFIFFSREFILLYFSYKYVESYKVFILFSVALLTRFQNYGDVLVLLKKSRYVLMSFIVYVILNISLNLLLVKNYGILGCAAASVFSVYVLSFLQLHFVVRQLKVTYQDYMDIPKLLKILFVSIIVIGLAKLAFYYLELPILVSFVSAGILTLPALFVFFVKKKYIDIVLYKSIFDKIPIFGNKIYNILS